MEHIGYDARSVANYLLDLARQYGIALTNLQLQKIVFFAHGTYLQRFGCDLILNRFEAWDHGPVVPELYHSLKVYRDKPITGMATRFQLEDQRLVPVLYDFPLRVQEHLKDTLLFYGRMNPWELVKLSHAPNGPWFRTRQNAEQHVNFSMMIDAELIRKFFSSAGIDSVQ